MSEAAVRVSRWKTISRDVYKMGDRPELLRVFGDVDVESVEGAIFALVQLGRDAKQVVLGRRRGRRRPAAALTFEIRDQRRRRNDYSTGNDLSHLPSPSGPSRRSRPPPLPKSAPAVRPAAMVSKLRLLGNILISHGCRPRRRRPCPTLLSSLILGDR